MQGRKIARWSATAWVAALALVGCGPNGSDESSSSGESSSAEESVSGEESPSSGESSSDAEAQSPLPASTPEEIAQVEVGDRVIVPDREEPTPNRYILRHDALGAEAAAMHYLDLYEYALATFDIQRFTDMSDPSCERCQDAIATIEERADLGTPVIGRISEVERTQMFEVTDVSGQFEIWIAGTQTEGLLLNSDHEVAGVQQSAQYFLSLLMQIDDDQWRVLDMRSGNPEEATW